MLLRLIYFNCILRTRTPPIGFYLFCNLTTCELRPTNLPSLSIVHFEKRLLISSLFGESKTPQNHSFQELVTSDRNQFIHTKTLKKESTNTHCITPPFSSCVPETLLRPRVSSSTRKIGIPQQNSYCIHDLYSIFSTAPQHTILLTDQNPNTETGG